VSRTQGHLCFWHSRIKLTTPHPSHRHCKDPDALVSIMRRLFELGADLDVHEKTCEQPP
jgi:hypothetical protein